MDHGQGVQDHLDALARARKTYAPGWEPLLAAEEVEPGVWHMMAQYGRCYGIVRLLEIGGERGYRATTGEDDPGDRQLLGYFRTLRAATRFAHMAFVRRHGQTGPEDSRSIVRPNSRGYRP